jgi:hypothetical protein
MKHVTRRTVAAAALCAIICVGVPARAQETPPVDPNVRAQVVKLSEEGAILFQARDYRRANEKLQQAYALDPDPNLLYNIAKCYEALGDSAAAIEKYEAFLHEPGGDPGGKQRARDAIRVLKGASSASSTPPGAKKDAPAASGHQRYVLPAVIAVGLGVVGVGVGSVFGVMALGKRSDLDATCTSRVCPPTSKDAISSLKTTSTISTIGFIAGGVGLALGATLFIVGRPSSSEERGASASVSVRPYVGWSSAGLVGSF